MTAEKWYEVTLKDWVHGTTNGKKKTVLVCAESEPVAARVAIARQESPYFWKVVSSRETTLGPIRS